jgi:hypothetical protein
MMLNTAEKAFIARRRRLIRSWPYVGSGAILLLASFLLWLVVTKPLLANPFFVISELQRGAIEQSTLTLMAGMLPVAVLAAIFVCILTLILVYVAISNERKYLALLERCSGG